ncbi:7,8-dihydropterin-6-yl-methyl-4-(beta-D-ribofuranosyl)aminobenzene 5'-phosphate synthase [Algoriphagus halophilus]|uniref:7,8-dihydropterin-6-yl-methyl-4-(Beta-D-ribofuranosyl)aminobenzene 5'-phosphate synthase n=2 Tax=Algoriphagus halophilus TaxID=226505 RepID=A0A1N6G3T1_9BACT|nr:7,8-dihydropterin-6-yl-methyl-4-(beta-D-ribofuranosyl)aminobenzene 5'-phosphate synthase [Algoriphagus halophilus]
MVIRKYLALLLLIILNTNLLFGQQEDHSVSQLKVTTLSTMLVNLKGVGEWGYSALIEVDGKKILFDTGAKPETVLQNAREMDIDLSDVEDVLLSHNHWDHIGGLLTLRQELKKQNPNALKRIHVGEGIFSKRVNSENTILAIREELEADGVEFYIYENQQELFPGVWITGPINRIHNERNWSGNGKIETASGLVEDTIPEDQSLVINTKNGLVLISGCGHAGLINTLDHIVANSEEEKVFAIIGGFHLFNASEEHLNWTASKLRDFGVSKIIGAHCTGINSLYTLRGLLELDRSDAVVGSVGDVFDLQNGIKAGPIAR